MRIITVNDRMQKGYRYELAQPAGMNFDPDFTPDLTPKEMLELGVFGGKYMTDCRAEFPKSWFSRAKLSPEGRDPSLNFFKVDASQPLSVWRKKGWIHDDDPRGSGEDARQIGRWRAIQRHIAQIRANCDRGDLFCRPRQRQALLQWAYDSRKI